MNKKDRREVERLIGYRFRHKELLETALTHPSFRAEKPEEASDDNQRLEFLGDAVLSLLTAEHVFRSRTAAREGEMSRLRSRLTADRKLAEIAARLGLGKFLRLGHGESLNGGAQRPSNLADAMEAILGAAWLDGGPKAAHKIFKRIFLPETERLEEASTAENNPKGELQEFTQARGMGIPVYRTVETTGPEHNRTFTVEVEIKGQTWQGEGKSKREAERRAAARALDELNRPDASPPNES